MAFGPHFLIWSNIYMRWFLNFITCFSNLTSFSTYSPKVFVRVLYATAVTPAHIIVWMHHLVLALKFTGISIWHGSSSTIMHITSHVTETIMILSHSRHTVLFHGNVLPYVCQMLFGSSLISQFVFQLLSSKNITLCYANLPSFHTTVCGFGMLNHHQLKTCIVASPQAWRKPGTCWSEFFNKIVVSTHALLVQWIQ
jgi:hypothetical protein